jgi:hypothetical protein
MALFQITDQLVEMVEDQVEALVVERVGVVVEVVEP